MNKETRRKDSARSDLRRGCKRITSSVLVSRKKEETLCRKERTGSKKRNTKQGRCWLRKNVYVVLLIIWKEECGVCVDFNTKEQQQREAQGTV